MDDTAPGPGLFARRLRAFREHAALSQEELAERAGLTSNAIGALERGERRRPYPHTVRALAAALELDEAGRTALAAAARPGATREGGGSVGLTDEEGAGSGPSPPQAHTVVEPATRLVGRDDELAAIVHRVRTGPNRLVTLTGPGGVGKTRLALATAARLGSAFPDGVALAELAPVRATALVLPTVAGALGLPQIGPGDVLSQLSAYIGARRTLLLLDNVEHVLPAAPEIGELLDRCPALVVLATSRAPLRVRAEQEVPVSTLGLPTASSPTAVMASPAGQMFLDRARAVTPSYTLTPESAPMVAEICRRLDGLPLALELAAAHFRLLDPATLLARLDQAVGIGRSRELPERQRTLPATLDWSHSLLTRQEQTLLRRLAVFAGGFTLPAAERVAGADLDGFAALTGLVDQSLVVAPDAHGRYRLLEPIRQYAAARLAAADEAAVVSTAHATYFADLAAHAHTGLRGPDQGRWLARLDREQANLRTAIATLAESGQAGQVALLFGRTWLYWAFRGHAGEALGWLDRVLDGRVPTVTSEEYAAGHVALAGLRYATGDLAGTQVAGTAAADRLRQAGSATLLAEALVLAGSGAALSRDVVSAQARLTEAEQFSSVTDAAWVRPHAALLRAQIFLLSGDLGGCQETLVEAERLARELAGPFTLATALNLQASCAQLAGRDAQALDQLIEAATMAAEADITWTLVYTLPGLAGLAVRADLPELAVRLYAAGATLAEGNGLALSFPPDVARAARGLAAARAHFDPTTFDALWESGRSLTPAEVAQVAEAIRPRLPAVT